MGNEGEEIYPRIYGKGGSAEEKMKESKYEGLEL